MRLLLPICVLAAAAQSAGWAQGVVIDRLAVIVGKNAIKSSDVERDLRLTAFLNQTAVDRSAKARRESAGRLVDQQIIRAELAAGGYSRATDAQADALLSQIRRDRFGDSAAKLRAALSGYGLTQDELKTQLLWQLTVLQFIQQRFQPEANISDDEVRAYYDQHATQLRREHPQNSSFEALQDEIRRILEGEAINKAFENWIVGSRQQIRIVYREGAFQ
jgi:hypothetical protein